MQSSSPTEDEASSIGRGLDHFLSVQSPSPSHKFTKSEIENSSKRLFEEGP